MWNPGFPAPASDCQSKGSLSHQALLSSRPWGPHTPHGFHPQGNPCRPSGTGQLNPSCPSPRVRGLAVGE